MHVSRGWSGEYASGQWGKCSVGVGDEDFDLLLYQHSCVEIKDLIPYREKWRLLDLMTEELLTLELASRFNMDVQKASEKVAEAITAQKAIIAKLKATLTP